MIFVFTLLIVYASSRNVDDLPRLHDLPCKKCERIYVPVCGSNNKTFTNECRLNCNNFLLNKTTDQRITILRFGPCISFFRRSIGNLITQNDTGYKNISEVTIDTSRNKSISRSGLIKGLDNMTQTPKILENGLHEYVTHSLNYYDTD